MMETRKKEMFEKLMQDPEVDPEVKEFLEKLHSDDDASSLLHDLLTGELPMDLLQRIIADDDDTDEEKAAQAERIFDGIKGFIEEHGWKASVVDKDNRVFILHFGMKNASLKVLVRVDADAECVSINTTLPIICLEEFRMLMAIRLNRLNENLRYGAFRLDEDDGEITYRFSYSYSGQEFNGKLFDKYLDCCLLTPDINYKSVAKTATGSMSKEDKVSILEELKTLATAINS